MKDYDNMPVLDWGDAKAPQKARAQIIHQEPVILNMPLSFDTSVNGADFGCKLDKETGILYNCDGGKLLNTLASLNELAYLDIVAEACIESNSQVDVDGARHRLIVHD